MNDKEYKLYVCGTRTTSSEVADLVPESIGIQKFGGYIENQWQNKKEFCGAPVFWVDKLPSIRNAALVCGIASSYQRRLYVESLANHEPYWGTLIHRSASISKRAHVQRGAVISRHACIAHDSHLGQHCFLNRGVLLGHDCQVGDFVTFSPGANVAGCCHIGDGAYIAMGAVVVDRIRIGVNAFVAAGAVVVKDVPPNTAVRGVPARPFKLAEGSRALERIDASRYEIG